MLLSCSKQAQLLSLTVSSKMKIVLVVLGEADLLTASCNQKTYEHRKHKNKYFSNHSYGKGCFFLEPGVRVVGVADRLASRCGAVHSLVEVPIFVLRYIVADTAHGQF